MGEGGKAQGALGQFYTAQLACGAGGGELPGESRVFGMHGVDEQISWLSMKQGEVVKSLYAMKMHTACDKDLRESVGDMHSAKNMPNPCGFPVSTYDLPPPRCSPARS